MKVCLIEDAEIAFSVRFRITWRTETDGKVPAVGTARFQSSAHCALTASGWTSRNRS
jgi:hypothetical protein